MDNSRFKATLPEGAWIDRRVMIVGCGGIGSYVAPLLVRMGCQHIALVDYDHVCSENVATQDVAWLDAEGERAKVHSVGDRLRSLEPTVDVRTWPAAFNSHHLEEYNPDVVVLSVDSIEVREAVMGEVERWARLSGGKANIKLVVDPRMGFEELEVYTWTPFDSPEDEAAYIATLAERDHRELPCGAKAIAYTGGFAGSVVASVIRRWLVGVSVPWLVCGDIGSYGFMTTWRWGQGYEECPVGTGGVVETSRR